MRNKLILFLLVAVLSTAALAAAPAIRSDHPNRYTVVRGDTLWDISARFLQQPWRWPEIWEVNPQIANPHLIYPGDVVYLSYRDGRPILTVDRGSRYVKLSPEVRSYPNDGAIPSIPIEYIQPFLSPQLVVSEDEMSSWPYIVSSYDQHLVAGPGNKIYIRGRSADATATQYSIYRQGPAYVLPEDTRGYDRLPVVQSQYNYREIEGEILGYQALYVGEAEIVRDGDPASAIVIDAEREILVGDRLAPRSKPLDLSSDFIPTTPSTTIDAKIVSVIDGVSEVGNYQVVVVSAGTEEDLKPGDVLAVYQTGNVVRDVVATQPSQLVRKNPVLEHFDAPGVPAAQIKLPVMVELPAEFAGVVMVFRTFERVSYALVMDTERSIHIYDTVTNP